jgi:hypothetical protein
MEGEGFDEEALMKKINRMLEEFLKRTEGSSEATKKNITQLMKSTISIERHNIVEKEATKRQTESIRLRAKSNMEFERFHNEEMRRKQRLGAALGKTQNSFNFMTQSLTKGRGIGATLGLLGEGAYKSTKAFYDLEKAQKAYTDALLDPSNKNNIDAKRNDLEDAQITKDNDVAGKSGFLGKIAKSLSKAGSFFEKHSVPITIGAGVAGLIIGIISKALSVAPMFQAMMKLMKFAVLMILMPIGTFFGAVIRPLMVGIVKGLAPKFKQWMEGSMHWGAIIGERLLAMVMNPKEHFENNPDQAAGIGGIFGGIGGAGIMGIGALFSKYLTDTEKDREEYKAKLAEEREKRNNALIEAGKMILQPILMFVGKLNVLFLVTIPAAFNGFITGLQNMFNNNDLVKQILQPILMFIGKINYLFLKTIPDGINEFASNFKNFWAQLWNGFVDFFQWAINLFGLGDVIKKVEIPDEDNENNQGMIEYSNNMFWTMESINKNISNIKPKSISIEGFFSYVEDNLSQLPNHTKFIIKAMTGITNQFDGAWKWISNALRKVSRQTYTTGDGSKKPTRNAKIAMGTLSNMGGGGIDSSGSPSYGSAAYHYSFLNPVKMAKGGIIDEPILGIGASGQSYLMGESGREFITPEKGMKKGNTIININIGKVEKDVDLSKLKPMIQRWILESNSRRGMI